MGIAQFQVIPKLCRWQPSEILLGALGAATLIMLLARSGGGPPALWLSLALAAFVLAVFTTRPAGPWRLLVNYAFTLWFYSATDWIVPALHVPIQSQNLLAWDRTMFGQTPSVAMQRITVPWLTDLMSLFYLSYLVYLHIVLIHALFQTDAFRARLSTRAFATFVVGFAGYLLVPAQCPGRVFPELYAAALSGGILTRATAWIATHAAAAYDVFPSLHVLVTLILLSFDWQYCRRRFWIMIFPTLMLIFSTLYLRLHYGVDLMAAALLFGAYLVGRRFLVKS